MRNKDLQQENKENNCKVGPKILGKNLAEKNVLGERCRNTNPDMRKKNQHAIEKLNDKVHEITKHIMGESRVGRNGILTSEESEYIESMTQEEKEAFMAKYKMKKPFDPNSMLHHMDMFTFRS